MKQVPLFLLLLTSGFLHAQNKPPIQLIYENPEPTITVLEKKFFTYIAEQLTLAGAEIKNIRIKKGDPMELFTPSFFDISVKSQEVRLNIHHHAIAKLYDANNKTYSNDLEIAILLHPALLSRPQVEDYISRRFSINVSSRKSIERQNFSRSQLKMILDMFIHFSNIKIQDSNLLKMTQLSTMHRSTQSTIPGIDGRHAAATYNPTSNTILLASSSVTPENLVHEIGHALWIKAVETYNKLEYLNFNWQLPEINASGIETPIKFIAPEAITAYSATLSCDESGRKLSDYLGITACSWPMEDFPENFSTFFSNPARLKKVSPQIFDYIRYWLGGIEFEYKGYDNLTITLRNGVKGDSIHLSSFSYQKQKDDANLSIKYGFAYSRGREQNYIKSFNADYAYHQTKTAAAYLPGEFRHYVGEYNVIRNFFTPEGSQQIHAHIEDYELEDIRPGFYQAESLTLFDRFNNKTVYPKDVVKTRYATDFNPWIDFTLEGTTPRETKKLSDILNNLPAEIVDYSRVQYQKLSSNQYRMILPFEIPNEVESSCIFSYVSDLRGREVDEITYFEIVEGQRNMIDITFPGEQVKDVTYKPILIVLTFPAVIKGYAVEDPTYYIFLDGDPSKHLILVPALHALKPVEIDFTQAKFGLELKPSDCNCTFVPSLRLPVKDLGLEPFSDIKVKATIRSSEGTDYEIEGQFKKTENKWGVPSNSANSEYHFFDIKGTPIDLKDGTYTIHDVSISTNINAHEEEVFYERTTRLGIKRTPLIAPPAPKKTPKFKN